jgi:NADH dehydrogenase FAD-containing subunit
MPNLNDDQRKKLLHFSLVGGGPTGVEFAAELHDFVKEDIYRKYPTLKGLVNITLYDVAPDILLSFDEYVVSFSRRRPDSWYSFRQLRRYAKETFKREGVEIRTKSKITAVEKDRIVLDDGDGKSHEGRSADTWTA